MGGKRFFYEKECYNVDRTVIGMRIAVVAEAEKAKDMIFTLGVQLEDTAFSFRWFAKLAQYAKAAQALPYDVLILSEKMDLPRFRDTLFTKASIVLFVDSASYQSRKYNQTTFLYLHDFQKELPFCLHLLKQCAKGKQYYLIHTQGASMQIRLRDIYYVEKQEKYLLYHTKYGIFQERGTLKEKEAKWQEDGFVRVHHAFLLNLRSVKAVRGDEVELINQERIPISRSKKHRFYETLQTFQPDDAS